MNESLKVFSAEKSTNDKKEICFLSIHFLFETDKIRESASCKKKSKSNRFICLKLIRLKRFFVFLGSSVADVLSVIFLQGRRLIY